MDEVLSFFLHLFFYEDFNPRNTCGTGWTSSLVTLHIVSDFLIWFSYLAIPCILVYFIRKRKDAPFPHIVWLFGAFILSCGTTHLVGMLMFSFPMYRLDGLIKLITGFVSLATVVALVPVVPRVLAMRSPRDFELEIAERKILERALRESQLDLEKRVEARTAELHKANTQLQAEIARHKVIQNALKDTEARKTAILESALDGMVSMDHEGRIVEFNPAAERIFGYNRDEVIGQALSHILVPKPLTEVDVHERRSIEARGMGELLGKRLEWMARRADGTEFLVELSISAVRWDGPPLFTGFVRDITERKKTEALLEQHTAELARSNSDLEQFAYVASHDMQEPIRMVVSYMQLLSSNYKEKLDGKAIQYIGYAVEGSKRMQELIKGLLSYSRIGRATESYQPIDTNTSLATALRNLRQIVLETDAQITYERLPTVMGDATQMIQVFQNLIGNAIKFVEGKRPEVSISAASNGESWVFSIKDNGIGVEPRQYQRIFQIFQRLNERERFPGSGIGLATCKKIIERLGGRIWVESQPGSGSTFYFTMPQSPRSSGFRAIASSV